MKIHETERMLRKSLGVLRLPLGARARSKLRIRVFDYIDVLKRDGSPPERLIVQLRHLVRESAEVGPIARHIDELEKLVTEMVGWCIERYYADDVIDPPNSRPGWRRKRVTAR